MIDSAPDTPTAHEHEEGKDGDRAHSPKLSFGLPVRNASKSVATVVGSLLAQSLESIEVVVCDNASTDETQALCERLSHDDPRVRYFRNPADIGQIENFNEVLARARGEYFRWIGADDTLDPSYASLCVAELDNRRDLIGVTTEFQFLAPDGTTIHTPYSGDRVDAASPLRRLERCLFLQNADRGIFDPIYSTFRREVLLQTKRLRIDIYTDYLLALELCLTGRIGHIDRVLATRRLPEDAPPEVIAKRYHPSLAGKGWMREGSQLPRFTAYHALIEELGWHGRQRFLADALLAVYAAHSVAARSRIGRNVTRRLKRVVGTR